MWRDRTLKSLWVNIGVVGDVVVLTACGRGAIIPIRATLCGTGFGNPP